MIIERSECFWNMGKLRREGGREKINQIGDCMQLGVVFVDLDIRLA